jgi:OOP family OmpA-OmpF porin
MNKTFIWLMGIAAWLLLAFFCVTYYNKFYEEPMPGAQAVEATTPLQPLTLSKMDGQWWLSGAVPNESAKAALIAQSHAKLGDEVLNDQIQIYPGAPVVPMEFPPDLRGLREPLAQWDGQKLYLRGLADQEQQLQSIRDALPPAFKAQLKDAMQVEANLQERVQQAIQGQLEKPLEFEASSQKLTTESRQRLNDIAKQLAQVPDAIITIGGHTDNDGTDKANMRLSQARADSVRKQLISLGVPATRLHTKAFGASQPIADNKTSAGRARNRRIEFTLQ